ncbi:MAG: hypothetical protein LBS69_03275 [Prevotellaceae bacterium]|jgi:hypothetical protein|nr:hypothetical protein [Prevotellaceae bacterium]
MKSSKNKKIKPCECGSIEFISKPNHYDIYEIIDDKLILTSSDFIDDDEKLYCRECSKELKNGIDFID